MDIMKEDINLCQTDILSELDLTENEICKILVCAQNTLKELENSPNSDVNILRDLSVEYFESIASVRDKMLTSYEKFNTISAADNNKDIKENKNVKNNEDEIFIKSLDILQASSKQMNNS